MRVLGLGRTLGRKARRGALALSAGVVLGAMLSSSGCACLTGLVTGAFTGAVDAPAEVYRRNTSEFHQNPIYWPFDLLFFVPVGMVFGPIAGAGKGLALDIEVLLDRTTYEKVFTTYKAQSVWRPYTIHW